VGARRSGEARLRLGVRALDKQERLVEELRARAGVVLAASSVAISFLGGRGFGGPGSIAAAALALSSFVVSVSGAVFVLLPWHDVRFALSASDVIENLIEFRDDPGELFRRAADALDRLWERNDTGVYRLGRALSVAVAALGVEVIALAGLLGGTII
jgi:hypothetical protein